MVKAAKGIISVILGSATPGVSEASSNSIKVTDSTGTDADDITVTTATSDSVVSETSGTVSLVGDPISTTVPFSTPQTLTDVQDTGTVSSDTTQNHHSPVSDIPGSTEGVDISTDTFDSNASDTMITSTPLRSTTTQIPVVTAYNPPPVPTPAKVEGSQVGVPLH